MTRQGVGGRNYLLGVLLTILVFNCMDRLVLGLLLQDIKVDLSLSDTQLGLLSGLAFALFYSLMGLPIARWGDRGNRVKIISFTSALWGVTTALCGLAGSFVQLLLIRVGVAIGEAGCVPPAHSLLADFYDRAERARALARYMLGPPLSALIGYFAAGWINQLYGWRVTFVLLGAIGIPLAALAWWTLRDPRFDGKAAPTIANTDAPALSMKAVSLALWRNVTFRQLLLANSILCFFGYGVANWQPAFFIRHFALETGELGAWLALIWGVGGIAGAWLGGEWATRHAAHAEQRQLRIMAMAQGAFAVVSAGVYLSADVRIAFALQALAAIGASATYGPFYATIQTLIEPRMRAVSIAIVYLFANLIGMGLGPLAVGALSDALRPWVGEDSLRYALLGLCPGFLWAGAHLWRASRTVMQDLGNSRDD